MRGTPYVFGGKDVQRDGGLDCSGFVCQVFSDIGINLGDPDYTSAQRIWDNAQDTGDDVRPGDIITFTRTYSPADVVTHIGIIREPRPVGAMWNANDAEGVAITDYKSGYWVQHYYGHRRIPGLEPPAIDSPWTAEQIAAATGCPADAIAENWPRLVRELSAVGQASRASLAAAIATCAIETASQFQPVEEAFWLPLAQRLAYYADTSQHAYYGNYWGRGDIQLSLEGNYRAAGTALGIDLVGHPELALDPDVAAKVFAWYWAARDIQAPADAGDWRDVRRRVQGADAGLDRLIAIVTHLL